MQQWQLGDKSFPCPITLVANLLHQRWRTNVLWHIWKGHDRFGELSRQLPVVNQGALMRVLRDLESDGLISRHETGKRPAPVIYALTELGHSLVPVLVQMAEWGRTHAVVV